MFFCSNILQVNERDARCFLVDLCKGDNATCCGGRSPMSSHLSSCLRRRWVRVDRLAAVSVSPFEVLGWTHRVRGVLVASHLQQDGFRPRSSNEPLFLSQLFRVAIGPNIPRYLYLWYRHRDDQYCEILWDLPSTPSTPHHDLSRASSRASRLSLHVLYR